MFYFQKKELYKSYKNAADYFFITERRLLYGDIFIFISVGKAA